MDTNCSPYRVHSELPFYQRYQLLRSIRIHVHLCVESTANYYTQFQVLNNGLHKHDIDLYVSYAPLKVAQIMLLNEIYLTCV